MKYLILVIALIPVSGFAAKSNKAASGDPGYTILLLQTGADKKAYQKAFPEAKVFTLEDHEKVSRRDVLPLVQQAQFFEKAGLSEKVKNMDTFDRDMLVRYLRHFDAGFVAKKYKNIPKQNIEVAQKMLKDY